jgi:hypothetical protein
MKPLFVFTIFLFSCKSPSEFLTSNEVHWEKVNLIFRDQTKAAGQINILHENSNSLYTTYSNFLQFIPEGRDSIESIDLYKISGYWFESNYYALKKLDIHMNGIYQILFVKRLTGENSRIQLYELYESGSGNSNGEIEYSYYLSYPSCGPLDAINTRSSFLLPSFEQKMSVLVADCPNLAQKILSKDHGYFIPFTSFNIKKHPDVLLRIIDEYNKCNQESLSP